VNEPRGDAPDRTGDRAFTTACAGTCASFVQAFQDAYCDRSRRAESIPRSSSEHSPARGISPPLFLNAMEVQDSASPRPRSFSRRSTGRRNAARVMRRCTSWGRCCARIGRPAADVPAVDCEWRPPLAGVWRDRPTTGSDTTQLKTRAVRQGDRYIVTARRSSFPERNIPTCCCCWCERPPSRRSRNAARAVDPPGRLRKSVGHGLTIRPIRTMMNHATTELFHRRSRGAGGTPVGREGEGFKYVLDGLNAERILIAAECVGDGRWFIERSTRYARDRIVFGRPIGQNQGVQFPIATAHIRLEAADLMRQRRPNSSIAISHAERKPTWRSTWRRMPRGKRQTSPFKLSAALASRGVRRRAEVPGDASVPSRARLDESHTELCGRACARAAAVLLMRPLDGLTVVALEQAVAAPLATRHLADLGAR